MLKIAYRPEYCHPLPPGHRFPMEKYSLLPEQLLWEGTVTDENFFAPDALTDEDILAIHDAGYWQKLKALSLSPKEERKTGFPLSEELVRREVIIMGGTVQACQFALEYGIAMNVAGGTHHAFADRGEGFCLLNDIALGASWLLRKDKAQRVLVVDLDVHQGNGTAKIFERSPEVFTFSMHCEANYPLHKETSDLDIGLPVGTGDKVYLSTLRTAIDEVLDRSKPDFVFYQSGVDVLAGDKLGHLQLTLEGCRERDRIVLARCRSESIPVVVSMGGGYSAKLARIIEAHANTFRLAADIVNGL